MFKIREMKGNRFNRDSKHFSRTCSRDFFFFICEKAVCAQEYLSVRVCVCVCHGGERAKRPLPCTQIITWFYNVAYLYSGQFPLGLGSGGGGVGGGWNNNAGHFTPASRRTFSALILSMGLTSFPR